MSDLPTLLPPNAQPLEYALEQLSARLVGIADPVAALWNADTCPEPLLGYLAWAFSVEVWDRSWPEAQRRQILLDAVQLHRTKGTVGAVRRALSGVGFSTDIIEWFEEAGEPYTFRIDAFGADVFAAGFQIDADLVRLLESVLLNVKPERAHFVLRVGENFGGDFYWRSGVIAAARDELGHDPVSRSREFKAPIFARSTLRVAVISKLTHEVERRAG